MTVTDDMVLAYKKAYLAKMDDMIHEMSKRDDIGRHQDMSFEASRAGIEAALAARKSEGGVR